MWALRYKHDEKTIKLLINKLTDINQKNKNGKTPLMWALFYKNDEKIIKLLINEKTDINNRSFLGYTPLMYALNFNYNVISKYDEKIIKLLINKKTDINQKDKSGQTPLIMAIKSKCDEKILKLLINKKTDINQEWNVLTPLIAALAYKNDEKIIKFLINQKADINKKNNYGETPLKYLLSGYSGNNLSLIILLFYSVDKKMINIIASIIHDSNAKYFLQNPTLQKEYILGWNLSQYLSWNNKRIKKKPQLNIGLFEGLFD